MRSNFIWLPFALLSLLLTGCPGPKSGQGDAQMDRLSPQVFRYGGIEVALLQNVRPPVELRIVVRHGGSLAEIVALETALEVGPEGWDREKFELWRDKYFAGYALQHQAGRSVLKLSTLPEQLSLNWGVTAGMFLRKELDGAAISEQVEKLRGIYKYYSETPGFGLQRLMQAHLGTYPPGLGPWPALDIEQDLAAEEVNAAWQGMIRKENIFLVVAGPADAEDVGNLLFETLSEIDGSPDSVASSPTLALRPTGFHGLQSEEQNQAMELVLQFEEAEEVSGAVLVLTEAIRLRMQQVFERDANARKGLSVGYFNQPAPIVQVLLEGSRVVPRAEFVMSELRNMKNLGLTEDEFAIARNQALTLAMGRYESNRAWANEMAQLDISEATVFFKEIAGIRQTNAKGMRKLLEDNWKSAQWFLVGDTAKVDKGPLLRF